FRENVTMEGKVTLNRKEQVRLMVLNQVEKGEMKGREAAEVLGISIRQFRRLIAAYRKKGAEGLAHGNRGRSPVNKLDIGIRERVKELAGAKYAGFNTQHLSEMLVDEEGIEVSRSTVRRILVSGGINRPRRRRAPKHRSRRERQPKKGMLVQVDGSHHDWLEGRGEKMTLIGGIDDATGEVLHALFREQEDTEGYFNLLQMIVLNHGIPMAIYHDGHTIVEPPDKESPSLGEQLTGSKNLTQFGRLLDELNSTSIRSRSPQARGRIERLWGTFQDRLVSQLRLVGASTISQANQVLKDYLPVHNRKFAVPPAIPGSAFLKPNSDWRSMFCLKYTRTVGLDNVVRFGNQRLQVLPDSRYSYAKAKVEVRESFDGSLSVYYQGRRLNTRSAPTEPAGLRKTPVRITTNSTPRQTHKPASDHPWRRSYKQFVDKGSRG
ncbi:MAG: ISNCY family transposase, partial [bacterium]